MSKRKHIKKAVGNRRRVHAAEIKITTTVHLTIKHRSSKRRNRKARSKLMARAWRWFKHAARWSAVEAGKEVIQEWVRQIIVSFLATF